MPDETKSTGDSKEVILNNGQKFKDYVDNLVAATLDDLNSPEEEEEKAT